MIEEGGGRAEGEGPKEAEGEKEKERERVSKRGRCCLRNFSLFFSCARKISSFLQQKRTSSVRYARRVLRVEGIEEKRGERRVKRGQKKLRDGKKVREGPSMEKKMPDASVSFSLYYCSLSLFFPLSRGDRQKAEAKAEHAKKIPLLPGRPWPRRPGAGTRRCGLSPRRSTTTRPSQTSTLLLRQTAPW